LQAPPEQSLSATDSVEAGTSSTLTALACEVACDLQHWKTAWRVSKGRLSRGQVAEALRTSSSPRPLPLP